MAQTGLSMADLKGAEWPSVSYDPLALKPGKENVMMLECSRLIPWAHNEWGWMFLSSSSRLQFLLSPLLFHLLPLHSPHLLLFNLLSEKSRHPSSTLRQDINPHIQEKVGGKERVPRAGKKQSETHLLRVPQKHPANRCNIHRESLIQTQAGQCLPLQSLGKL